MVIVNHNISFLLVCWGREIRWSASRFVVKYVNKCWKARSRQENPNGPAHRFWYFVGVEIWRLWSESKLWLPAPLLSFGKANSNRNINHYLFFILFTDSRGISGCMPWCPILIGRLCIDHARNTISLHPFHLKTAEFVAVSRRGHLFGVRRFSDWFLWVLFWWVALQRRKWITSVG